MDFDLHNGCAKYELIVPAKEEVDGFPFPNQPPFDSSASGYGYLSDWQNDQLWHHESFLDVVPWNNSSYVAPLDIIEPVSALKFLDVPLNNSYVGPSYAPLDTIPSSSAVSVLDIADPLNSSSYVDPSSAPLDIIEPISSSPIQENSFNCYGNGFGRNELADSFDKHNEQPQLLRCDTEESCERPGRGAKSKSYLSEERNKSLKVLDMHDISKYFYMPIVQAAKELNVGLTLLKKRCRDLGIGRWPHRKLMSLQKLIENVKDMLKDERQESSARKLNETLKVLEKEKRMMEKRPDLQLGDKTKRLRQACFKANYKKKKLMLVESATSGAYESEDEEIKYLLSEW